MDKRKSQKERVLSLLKNAGKQGVMNYTFYQLKSPILRASARVYELRKEGYNIETEQIKKGYYKYILRE